MGDLNLGKSRANQQLDPTRGRSPQFAAALNETQCRSTDRISASIIQNCPTHKMPLFPYRFYMYYLHFLKENFESRRIKKTFSTSFQYIVVTISLKYNKMLRINETLEVENTQMFWIKDQYIYEKHWQLNYCSLIKCAFFLSFFCLKHQAFVTHTL